MTGKTIFLAESLATHPSFGYLEPLWEELVSEHNAQTNIAGLCDEPSGALPEAKEFDIIVTTNPEQESDLHGYLLIHSLDECIEKKIKLLPKHGHTKVISDLLPDELPPDLEHQSLDAFRKHLLPIPSSFHSPNTSSSSERQKNALVFDPCQPLSTYFATTLATDHLDIQAIPIDELPLGFPSKLTEMLLRFERMILTGLDIRMTCFLGNLLVSLGVDFLVPEPILSPVRKLHKSWYRHAQLNHLAENHSFRERIRMFIDWTQASSPQIENSTTDDSTREIARSIAEGENSSPHQQCLNHVYSIANEYPLKSLTNLLCLQNPTLQSPEYWVDNKLSAGIAFAIFCAARGQENPCQTEHLNAVRELALAYFRSNANGSLFYLIHHHCLQIKPCFLMSSTSEVEKEHMRFWLELLELEIHEKRGVPLTYSTAILLHLELNQFNEAIDKLEALLQIPDAQDEVARVISYYLVLGKIDMISLHTVSELNVSQMRHRHTLLAHAVNCLAFGLQEQADSTFARLQTLYPRIFEEEAGTDLTINHWTLLAIARMVTGDNEKANVLLAHEMNNCSELSTELLLERLQDVGNATSWRDYYPNP